MNRQNRAPTLAAHRTVPANNGRRPPPGLRPQFQTRGTLPQQRTQQYSAQSRLVQGQKPQTRPQNQATMPVPRPMARQTTAFQRRATVNRSAIPRRIPRPNTYRYRERFSPIRPAPITTNRYQSLPRGELQARYRRHLLNLVNQEREKHDAEPVILDPKLSTCAKKHNADLAFTQRKLSHVGNDGSKLSQRLKRCGYDFRYASENIARGQKNPQHVVSSWMKSEGHKRNLISDRVEKMGVHVGRGVDGKIYWAQLFATK